MSEVVQVTDASFEQEVLQSDKPVLVDFYADSCGPCRAVAPFVAKLAEEFDGKVKFTKVDVAREMQTATKYQITGIPALMIIEGGEIKDQVLGARNDLLRKMVETAAGAAQESA